MRKGVKICLIVSVSVTILITILIAAIIFIFSNVEVKISLNKQEPSTTDQITDDDILAFLESVDIINENDVYINYDRDIGLFGPEGNKRYIYRRVDESHYYVEISRLSYSSYREISGYEYKPYEVFYKIYIQDCRYNIYSESMDERILERLGDSNKYIVSGKKNDFKLNIVERSDESP